MKKYRLVNWNCRSRRNRRSGRSRTAGFTLVEIMVVVIVIGILAAVIIPNLAGRTDEARITKARSDISRLMIPIEAFNLDMHRYPAEEEGLAILREPPNSDDAELWKGPYLNTPLPNDPWGNAYRYYSPAPNGIDIYGIETLGSDARADGEGAARDINSWTNYVNE